MQVEQYVSSSAKKVSIKGVGERLRKEKESSQKILRALVGNWVVQLPRQSKQEYAFDAKGNVRCVTSRQNGTVRVEDGEIVARMGGGRINRFELRGPTLMVETFDSAAAFPYDASAVEVATRKMP